MSSFGEGRPRGQIAVVLLTAMVALTLIFTIAAGAVSGLRFTTHASNATQALNLAEAAAQTAVARLRKDIGYGRVAGLLEDMPAAEIKVEDGQAQGLLSFHPRHATDLGIPLSRNNVDSDSTLKGWNGRTIPAEGVQLVGVGSCGGVRRTVEFVLNVPRFPYVISCSGPFVSQGALTVGVLPEQADPTDFQVEDLLPGHLLSNSVADRAIDLKDQVVISGDLEAAGRIVTSAPAKVLGQIRPGAPKVALAALDVKSYDPEGIYSSVDTFSGASEDTTLSGYYKGTGEVKITRNLNLDSGVLYVDGNLEIKGGVTGKGALIATGSITIEQNSQLEADQQVAIVSKGDINLHGGGAFRGVIYTEGNLDSGGVQLMGSLVANSKTGGTIKLDSNGVLASEPNMNFDKGWLCEKWVDLEVYPTGEGVSPAEKPRVRQRGKYLGEDPESGLSIVEWSFEIVLPGGSGALVNPPKIREYYDQDGKRVRSDYHAVIDQRAAENGNGEERSIPDRISDGYFAGLLGVMIDDQLPWVLAVSEPPELTAKKVRVYRRMQNFELNFSQFLRKEDQLRLLLRSDH